MLTQRHLVTYDEVGAVWIIEWLLAQVCEGESGMGDCKGLRASTREHIGGHLGFKNSVVADRTSHCNIARADFIVVQHVALMGV